MAYELRFALALSIASLLTACGGGGGGGGAGTGPAPVLSCMQPADGAIVLQSPGTVNVAGSVSASNGLRTFTVNGASVPVAGGAFSAPVNAVFGINFVDLAATDAAGLQAHNTCAFLLSDTYAAEGSALSDAISVRNAQAVFDDVAGFLRTIANSGGFRSSLNASLVAANPLKPDSCDQSVTVPPFPPVCVIDSAVDYAGLDAIAGAFVGNSSLTLVNGGLAAQGSISNLRVNLRVTGHVSGIPFDTTGTVTVAFVNVALTFDTALSGGRPRASVRNGSVAVTVGTVSTDFSGLDGFVLNLVASLAQGLLQNMVANAFTGYISSNFGGALDGILSSMDVRTLSASFQVPRLDGSGSLSVAFQPGFSSLNASTARLLTGLSTLFTTAAAHARPSLGAPVPSGLRLLDPASSTQTQAAVHSGLFDQLLHALWRGGYFDPTLAAGALGLVPVGASLALTANLPPAAILRDDGRFEIALGAVSFHLDDPALVGAPLDGTLGGRVSCLPQLTGNDVVFGTCTVDELHVSPGRALGAASQAALEAMLGPILGAIGSSALNALPALPLPNFSIPAALANFGLPAGAALGMLDPTLTPSGRHLLLTGAFGLQ